MTAMQVVPLTGHVDRNLYHTKYIDLAAESCPSRGTWIEMLPRPRSARPAARRAPHGARG